MTWFFRYFTACRETQLSRPLRWGILSTASIRQAPPAVPFHSSSLRSRQPALRQSHAEQGHQATLPNSNVAQLANNLITANIRKLHVDCLTVHCYRCCHDVEPVTDGAT